MANSTYWSPRRSETPVNQGFSPLQLHFWQNLKRCNTLGVGVAFYPPTDFSTTLTAAADSNYTAETCANRPRSSLDTGDLQQHGSKERRQLCRFWRTVSTKHSLLICVDNVFICFTKAMWLRLDCIFPNDFCCKIRRWSPIPVN